MRLRYLSIVLASLLLSACSKTENIVVETENKVDETIVIESSLESESVLLNEIDVIESIDDSDEPYVDMIIGDSDIFSEEEIKNALFKVYDDFIIPDATLLKAWYDEEKCNKLKDVYMESGRGSLIENLEANNVIVILTNFKIADDGRNPVLEAGQTYEEYQWYLIRNNNESNWIIDSCGY